MKHGVSKSKRKISFEISIWQHEDIIKIASKAGGFITTVNNRPNNKRCHENLYGHLKDLLVQHGKWEDMPEK